MAQKLPANFVKRVNSGKEAGHVRKMTALREVVLTFTESEWSKLQAECRRLQEKEGRSLTGSEMVETIVGKWLESSPQGALAPWMKWATNLFSSLRQVRVTLRTWL